MENNGNSYVHKHYERIMLNKNKHYFFDQSGYTDNVDKK